MLAPIRHMYSMPSGSHYNEAFNPLVPEPALQNPDNPVPVHVVEEPAHLLAKYPIDLVLLHSDCDRIELIVHPAENVRMHLGQETVQPCRILASSRAIDASRRIPPQCTERRLRYASPFLCSARPATFRLALKSGLLAPPIPQIDQCPWSPASQLPWLNPIPPGRSSSVAESSFYQRLPQHEGLRDRRMTWHACRGSQTP